MNAQRLIALQGLENRDSNLQGFCSSWRPNRFWGLQPANVGVDQEAQSPGSWTWSLISISQQGLKYTLPAYLWVHTVSRTMISCVPRLVTSGNVGERRLINTPILHTYTKKINYRKKKIPSFTKIDRLQIGGKQTPSQITMNTLLQCFAEISGYRAKRIETCHFLWSPVEYSKCYITTLSIFLMLAWPCIIDINNVDNQLDAKIAVY